MLAYVLTAGAQSEYYSIEKNQKKSRAIVQRILYVEDNNVVILDCSSPASKVALEKKARGNGVRILARV